MAMPLSLLLLCMLPPGAAALPRAGMLATAAWLPDGVLLTSAVLLCLSAAPVLLLLLLLLLPLLLLLLVRLQLMPLVPTPASGRRSSGSLRGTSRPSGPTPNRWGGK
jgi:hypothetical protein